MGNPLTNYVRVTPFEEYKEMFKEHATLTREDGIILVEFGTNGGTCKWSERSHDALPLLMRYISMDRENEILIWTHNGEDHMQETDPNGWYDYKVDHLNNAYHDDTRLIQNMVFDIDIPTIGVMKGPGFHWDSVMLCDITICSEDARWDDFHFQDGTVPGDGMALLMQHVLGTKRANYLMYTSRQWDAKTALEWGWVNEVWPKDKVMDRAWELARIIKEAPRATREVTATLCKRPLQRMCLQDLKLHNAAESYATMICPGGDEKDGTAMMKYRFAADNMELLKPPTPGCNKIVGNNITKARLAEDEKNNE